MSKFRSRKSFIDSIKILVRGGAGGEGIKKYGGVGGKGGDVYLEAGKFKGLKFCEKSYPNKCISAQNGENSKQNKIYGEAGEDKVVTVPVGLTVYDDYKQKIGELNSIGEKLLVASGGKGGSPTSVPPFNGAKGQERLITLNLKLIADVGLVGFPNAGKSTLLKAISRAKPRIAAYAFTTLKPNLGVVGYDDLRQITVADLPGLVEGASNNVGMGHSFLKHVERTSVLLMVADIEGFQLNPNVPHRSCLETVILLNKELELYDHSLLYKPIILAVNKMDLPNSREKFDEILPYLQNLKRYVNENIPSDLKPERIIKFKKIVPISARFSKESISDLKGVLRLIVDDNYFRSVKGEVERKKMELIKSIEKQNTEFGAVCL